MTRTESPTVSLTRRVRARDVRCNVVSLRGELDAATKTLLLAVLAGAGDVEDADVIVDMSAVTFIDASAIGAIVQSRNRLHSRSRSLEIRAPSPVALKLLEICNLTSLIRVDAADTYSGTGAPALASWVDVPATAEPAPAEERSVDAMRTAASAGP